MDNSLSVALFAGLGGMAGWGLADFFAKKTIDKSSDLTTLFWGQLLGVYPLLLIFLIHPSVPHTTGVDWLFLVLFGIASALSYLPLYNGFGKGQVSLLSPIFASYAAVVALLSIIFFGEAVSVGRLAAIAVVFCGILLISADPREIRRLFKVREPRLNGVPEVLSAMVAYSFWLILFDRFINGKEWVFYVLVIRSMAALTLLVYSQVRQRSLAVKDKTLWKFLLGVGLFDVAAYSFVAYGFSHTDHVSVIAVLSGAFSVPTIILAHLFLKEKATKLQALATAIIIAGIGLVYIL